MKRLVAPLLILLLAACAQRPPLLPGPLAEADKAVETMIAQRQMPGDALWIEHIGHGSYHRAYGWRATDPAPESLDENTVFDAASLTKPVVTATLVQLLREQGKLDVDAPLQRYLPNCGGPEKAAITLHHLLTHGSGLPAGLPRKGAGDWSGIADAQRIACGLPLVDAPGTVFRYSDLNYILLGIIVAQQSGLPLEVFAEHALFRPLAMVDSGYLPLRRCAASPPHASHRPSASPTARCCAARCTTRAQDAWAAWLAMRACSPPPATSPASRACCWPAA